MRIIGFRLCIIILTDFLKKLNNHTESESDYRYFRVVLENEVILKPPAPARQSTVETKANAALFDPLNIKSEPDSTTVVPGRNDPFDGVGPKPNTQSQSYTPASATAQSVQQSGYVEQSSYQQQPQQPQQSTYQQPTASSTQYPSSAPSEQSYYQQSQASYPAQQTSQTTPQQQQYSQQEQQQVYPAASQTYSNQSQQQQQHQQQSAYPNSQSYAVQGQQASSFNTGYQQTVDQTAYASTAQQQASNPYRTMSPNSSGRYPQPTQPYPTYPAQQQQQVPTNATGLPYSATGYQ